MTTDESTLAHDPADRLEHAYQHVAQVARFDDVRPRGLYILTLFLQSMEWQRHKIDVCGRIILTASGSVAASAHYALLRACLTTIHLSEDSTARASAIQEYVGILLQPIILLGQVLSIVRKVIPDS